MKEKVFCKGCYDDVTDSWYCVCCEFSLNISMVYTETELNKIEETTNNE